MFPSTFIPRLTKQELQIVLSRNNKGAFGLSACLVFLLLLAWGAVCQAAVLPPGFTETTFNFRFKQPTAMAFAPGGRIFICEKGGRLLVVKNGLLLSTPFVTVTTDTSGERGLCGVTFDPNFSSNGYVYVYYTATTPAIHNRVSRFTASGDVAVANSEVILLEIDNSLNIQHNGGALHFGKDGKLYVAVGNDLINSNSQTLSNLRGKVLRINPDGTIPQDNPFYNVATGKNRAIWTLGLRNPFTFAVQPGTGLIYINDVGQSSWEEINLGIAGANYGWALTEGYTDNPSFQSPLYAYGHGSIESGDSSLGCAITGGDFYNPNTVQFPSGYSGKYFFLDFCNGWIHVFDPLSHSVSSFASDITGQNAVGLTVGTDGSLYYLSVAGTFSDGLGVLFQIRYTGNFGPQIGIQPANQVASVGESVTFSITAFGNAPLSYQWQRNGVDISGAISDTYITPPTVLADNGTAFRCRVSNSFGSVYSNAAILGVTSDQRPNPVISSPTSGLLYSPGDTINFSGSATDPEQGTLPASALEWEVRFEHHFLSESDHHYHPVLDPITGITSGSFKISLADQPTDTWYRILLTATDSHGLSRTIFRDIYPQIDPRLFNISTRLDVGIGDNVLIGGFIITGNQSKKVLVRGLGPTLLQKGVSNVLLDPTLELHGSNGAVITVNDNWVDSPDKQAIINTTLAPGDSKESAILRTLAPGPYTAILRGVNNTVGNALIEIYDIDRSPAATLGNISTRGRVGTAGNEMIVGFIAGGGGPAKVIVRAIGPELIPYGVTDALANPNLELHNGQGTVIATNDNWRDSQQTEIEASGIPPKNDLESAIVATLNPGNYTAIVRGSNNTIGIALVEVYQLY